MVVSVKEKSGQERFFPLLKGHLMDAETHRQYAPREMEFSSIYAEKLERLLENMNWMEWHALPALYCGNHILLKRKTNTEAL